MFSAASSANQPMKSSCVDFLKLLHVSGTSACFLNERILYDFDEFLRTGLCNLPNIHMSDDQWNQASLPVINGGLVIRRYAGNFRLLASIIDTRSLQDRLLHEVAVTVTDPLVVV